ncbi:flippase [Desulfatirhabdium butyrativorans]|uniref:flippase n=1 Tax=Desulfatirhabdium butyrativorans TaxID=340467 RepID=UPI00047F928A|nr:flippase [Desulfatirhabdium butyrativorans]
MQSRPLARITKNSIVGFVEKVVEIAAGLITVSILARYLDVEMFGLYTLIVTFAGMMLALCSVGLDRIMVRDIASDRINYLSYIQDVKGARLILAGISLAMILIMAVPMGIDSRLAVAALLVFSASETMSMYTNIYMSVFKAFEKMEYNTFITSIAKLLTISGLVIVVYHNLGFMGIFISIAAGTLAKAIMTTSLFQKKYSRNDIPISFAHSGKIVKDSLMIAASTFFAIASIRMGVFLLQAFGTLKDVAYFQAANVLLVQLQPAAYVIAMALYPAIASRKYEGDLLQKAATFIFIVSLPLMGLGFFYGDQLILLVYGWKYLEAVPAMKILILSVTVTFLAHLLEIALLVEYRQKLLTLAWGTAFFVNILLGMAVVPQYGLIGCATVMTISYVVLFCMLYCFVQKYTAFSISYRIFIKPVAGFLVMLLFLFSASNNQSQGVGEILIYMVASLILYGLMLFLLRVFPFPWKKRSVEI